jgi:hypothetical protein
VIAISPLFTIPTVHPTDSPLATSSPPDCPSLDRFRPNPMRHPTDFPNNRRLPRSRPKAGAAGVRDTRGRRAARRTASPLLEMCEATSIVPLLSLLSLLLTLEAVGPAGCTACSGRLGLLLVLLSVRVEARGGGRDGGLRAGYKDQSRPTNTQPTNKPSQGNQAISSRTHLTPPSVPASERAAAMCAADSAMAAAAAAAAVEVKP